MNLGFNRNSYARQWPLIVVALLALASFFYFYNAFNGRIAAAQQTVAVIVPKQDIQAYSSITADNLTAENIPLASADNYTARSAGQVSNMVATAQLYAGKPIDLRLLAKPSDSTGNFEVVGVNVDAARSVGVKPGDIVDVYWLQAQQGAWVPGQGSIPVAGNVRVLRVCDEHGQPINEGQSSSALSSVGAAISPPASYKEPKIVYLLVRPEDVAKVIGGSGDKNASIAFARKSSESTINMTGQGGDNNGSIGVGQGMVQESVQQSAAAGTTGAPSPGGGAAGSGERGQNVAGGAR